MRAGPSTSEASYDSGEMSSVVQFPGATAEVTFMPSTFALQGVSIAASKVHPPWSNATAGRESFFSGFAFVDLFNSLVESVSSTSDFIPFTAVSTAFSMPPIKLGGVLWGLVVVLLLVPVYLLSFCGN